MQRTGMAWLLLVCTILVVGCSKLDSPKAPTAAAAKAAVTPDSAPGKKDSIFVDGVSFTVVDGPSGGKELRYEGTLHNNSGKPVDGVELSISLVNASKASIGGQVTQYFFQPSVQPQGSQAMLVQVPALKVKDDFSALSAQINVSQVLKAQPATVAAPLPATGEAATPGAVTEPSIVAPAGAETPK